MAQDMEKKIENLINLYIDDYQGKKVIDKIKIFEHPDRAKVIDILEKLQKIIFLERQGDLTAVGGDRMSCRIHDDRFVRE